MSLRKRSLYYLDASVVRFEPLFSLPKLSKTSDECRRLISSFDPFAKFTVVGSFVEQLVAFDAAPFSPCLSHIYIAKLERIGID